MRQIGTMVFLLFAIPSGVVAQEAASQSELIELTAKIVAINHDARLVALEDEDGEVEEIYAGPEIKRFDELKVGDTLTFRYYESVLSRVRKPGEPAPTPSGEPTLVRGTGARPSATLSRQMTASVIVTYIDTDAPSLTVKTDEGQMMSFKIADKKNLEGVKVGDRLDITYTAAVMITVR